MKPWIETAKFVIDVDEDVSTQRRSERSEYDHVVSNVAGLDAELSRLIATLNAAQWEIKGLLPIPKGIARRETAMLEAGTPPQASVTATGWGVSVIDQIVVLAQRTLWIEDAEYEARLEPILKAEARVRIERERAEIERANARVTATIAKLREELAGLRSAAIGYKDGGLFSRKGWKYGGSTYDSEAEARAQQATDIRALEAKIADAESKLRPLPELP